MLPAGVAAELAAATVPRAAVTVPRAAVTVPRAAATRATAPRVMAPRATAPSKAALADLVQLRVSTQAPAAIWMPGTLFKSG